MKKLLAVAALVITLTSPAVASAIPYPPQGTPGGQTYYCPDNIPPPAQDSPPTTPVADETLDACGPCIEVFDRHDAPTGYACPDGSPNNVLVYNAYGRPFGFMTEMVNPRYPGLTRLSQVAPGVKVVVQYNGYHEELTFQSYPTVSDLSLSVSVVDGAGKQDQRSLADMGIKPYSSDGEPPFWNPTNYTYAAPIYTAQPHDCQPGLICHPCLFPDPSTNPDGSINLAQGCHPDTYIIQPGDTLWAIAERYMGNPLRWPDLCSEWRDDPRHLPVGSAVFFC